MQNSSGQEATGPEQGQISYPNPLQIDPSFPPSGHPMDSNCQSLKTKRTFSSQREKALDEHGGLRWFNGGLMGFYEMLWDLL